MIHLSLQSIPEDGLVFRRQSNEKVLFIPIDQQVLNTLRGVGKSLVKSNACFHQSMEGEMIGGIKILLFIQK